MSSVLKRVRYSIEIKEGFAQVKIFYLRGDDANKLRDLIDAFDHDRVLQ